MIVDDLVLAELERLAGVLMNAATSEPRKFSPSPTPDHERRVAAGADDDARGVGVHGQQGEGAVQPAARPRRIASVRSPVSRTRAADEVRGDLGVGLGLELDALGDQLGLERRRSSR